MGSRRENEDVPSSILVDFRIVYARYLPERNGSVSVEISTQRGVKSSAPRINYEGVVVFNAWLRAVVDNAPVVIRMVQVRKGISGAPGMACRKWMGVAVLDLDLEYGGSFVSKHLTFHGCEDSAKQHGNPTTLDMSETCPAHIPHMLLHYSARPFSSLLHSPSTLLEVPITPLRQGALTYAHGGFVGCAVSMISDPKWRSIMQRHLAQLCPDCEQWKKVDWDAYLEGILTTKKFHSFMMMCENSPILAAYGLIRIGCTQPFSSFISKSLSSLSPSIWEGVDDDDENEDPGIDYQDSTEKLLPPPPDDSCSGSEELGRRSSCNINVEPSASSENLPPRISLQPSEVVLSTASMDDTVPRAASLQETINEGQRSLGSSAVQTKRVKTFPTAINSNIQGPSLLGKLQRDVGVPPAPSGIPKYPSSFLGPSRRFSCQYVNPLHDRKSTWQERASLGKRTDSFSSNVSKYGYQPVALEWDIWINPETPWNLSTSTIDHGSSGALIKQSIYTLIGLRSRAKSAGKSHIRRQGISPIQWLKEFGSALNEGLTAGSLLGPSLQLHGPVNYVHHITIVIDGSEMSKLRHVITAGFSVKAWVENVKWPVPSKQFDFPPASKANNLMPDITLTVGPVDEHDTNGSIVISMVVKDIINGDSGTCGVFRAVDCSESKTILKDDEKDLLNRVKVRFSSENLGQLDAAMKLGIDEDAARSCLAMLVDPGGLYLDVKSAYSTAEDINLFISSLHSIGITVKGACSFIPQQLKSSLCRTVWFFHGLSGLENALDDDALPNDQAVLFNGASFLLEKIAEPCFNLGESNWMALIDIVNFNKYQALCGAYRFQGGVYIQEPDASPAAVDAITNLVNENPLLFPMGFAYGQIPGVAASVVDSSGRGFAKQQTLEEWQAKKLLSEKVKAQVLSRKHRNAMARTVIVWGQRLLEGRRVLSARDQAVFLSLLADFWPHARLPSVVAQIGGIQRIFLRFFQHYEVYTPYTLFEAGFNFNHTKDLLRLLRDRGVFVSLTCEEKCLLVKFFCSSAVYGYGLTYIMQLKGIRHGLHKFAKEGILCVLESCTREEVSMIMEISSGRQNMKDKLMGRLRLSWHYYQRLRSVERVHTKFPDRVTYQQKSIKYRALGHRGGPGEIFSMKPWEYTVFHTRDKSLYKKFRKLIRKSCCCFFTVTYISLMSFAPMGLGSIVCVPRGIVPLLPDRLRCGLLMSVVVVVLPLLGLFALLILLILRATNVCTNSLWNFTLC